jgi:hypothetical protein
VQWVASGTQAPTAFNIRVTANSERNLPFY